MNIHLIDRAAAEGQAREEVVDRLLVADEEEAGKGFGCFLTSRMAASMSL
jgi:hypothetical protein